jgi:site-specific DNA-methyltransferase (adenine-specific)
MRTNNIFNAAQISKNNEFYAVREELHKEIPYYAKEFKDKIVFCNCNDGLHMGFVNYFKEFYDKFGLKLLIYSEYGEGDANGKLYKYDGENTETLDLLEKGDFSKGLCLDMLDVCDIVVTGPPYSLFSKFVSLLFEHNKKFLIIGDIMHSSLSDVFSYIKNGQMWSGISQPIEFLVPDDYNDSTVFIAKDGSRRCKLGKEVWYTNMEPAIKKPFIKFSCKYDKKKYKTCDNIDAIYIDDTRHIPSGYNGLMCVSCGFIRKFSRDQFELISCVVPYFEGERKVTRLIVKRKPSNCGRPKRTDKEKKEYIEKVHYLLYLNSNFDKTKKIHNILCSFYETCGGIDEEYSFCIKNARDLGFGYKKICELPLPQEIDFDLVDFGLGFLKGYNMYDNS